MTRRCPSQDKLSDQPERTARAGEEQHQQRCVDNEHRPRVVGEAIQVKNDEFGGDGTEKDAFAEHDGIHHAEVLPRAVVAADDEQCEQLTGENDRQRFDEQMVVLAELHAFESQTIRRVVRERDEEEIEQHLSDPPLVHEVRDERGHAFPLQDREIGIVVDADTGEIDREDGHSDQEDQGGDDAEAGVTTLQQD